MEKKSQLQIFLEGTALLTAGTLALIFHVLKLLPESDAVLFLKFTLFDLLQTALKVVVLSLLWKYYKHILHEISAFYSQHLAAYHDTQSDLKFFTSIIHFFTLVFIYELVVPEVKKNFLLADVNQPFAVVALDVLFIFLGIALLMKCWNALQHFIKDISREKKEEETAQDNAPKPDAEP